MKTSSIGFPNMFNVVQNKVSVLYDNAAVANRSKCLLLTDPTEVYNVPDQGVGLKRYLWQYNNDNTRQMLKDRVVAQLRLHEPQCNPDGTQFKDGNMFTGSTSDSIDQHYNKLEMTIAIETKFGGTVTIDADKIFE